MHRFKNSIDYQRLIESPQKESINNAKADSELKTKKSVFIKLFSKIKNSKSNKSEETEMRLPVNNDEPLIQL